MATKGTKTKLSYGDGDTFATSNTFTDIARIRDIKPPKPKVDDIDVTDMDSPAGPNPDDLTWKEFDPGLADAGEVEFTLNFDKDQTDTLFGFLGKSKGWKVTFSDGSVWQLSGYIKEFGDEVEREKVVTSTATMKVSGKPAFVAASDS